jgi:hypothetical protein
MVSTRFSTPLWRLRWWRSVCSEPGSGIWARFDNGVWLALGVAAEPLLMPARQRDHRDPTAASRDLRTELRAQLREIQRLRMETEILREAAEKLIHHAPARERFAFVHRLRGQHGIRRLCRILVTDHNNYHARARAEAHRDERGIDEHESLAQITEIHTAHPAYGAERVTRELKCQDVQVGRRRSRSSRASKRRSASASGPTARLRAATSRTGSPTTTADGCTALD